MCMQNSLYENPLSILCFFFQKGRQNFMASASSFNPKNQTKFYRKFLRIILQIPMNLFESKRLLFGPSSIKLFRLGSYLRRVRSNLLRR